MEATIQVQVGPRICTDDIVYYLVSKFLGEGAFGNVYEGIQVKTQERVAIKFVSEKGLAKIKDEIDALLAIEHPNVLRGVSFSQGEHNYIDSEGNINKKVNYLVTECAEEGELFDWIAHGGRFEEPLARLFFKQMMNGIKACHDANVAHRDLKPENLLLDENFILKVADFGLAAPLSGRDGAGLLKSKVGTKGYFGPEIFTQAEYQGAPLDIFAAGVILFILLVRLPPFGVAHQSDMYFKAIQQDPETFWNVFGPRTSHLSSEAKMLIEAMLSFNPDSRPTTEIILSHPWLDGDTIDQDKAKEILLARKFRVTEQIEQDRAQKEKEIMKRVMQRETQGGYKSANLGAQMQIEKLVEPISKMHFYSTCPIDIIYEALIKHLDDQDIEYKKQENKYDLQYETEHVTVRVKILEQAPENYCVEFIQIEGPKIDFINEFIDYRDDHISFAHNSQKQ